MADIGGGVGLFPVCEMRFLALPEANVLLDNSFKYQLLAGFSCFPNPSQVNLSEATPFFGLLSLARYFIALVERSQS